MSKAKHAPNKSAAHESAGQVAVGHEYRDVNAPWTIFSGAVVGAIIIGCCIVGRWLFGQLLEPADLRSNTSATGEGLVLPPQPRLEGIELMSAEEQTGAAQLGIPSSEQEQLQTYGWVNKEQRTVRIPIRRAMEMVLEKGLSFGQGVSVAPQTTLKKPATELSDRNSTGPTLSDPGNTPHENR